MKRIYTPAGHALLDVRRICATQKIPAHLILAVEATEVESWVEKYTGDMILKTVTRIAGKRFDSKSVTYPETWFQGFLAGCLPTFCRWARYSPKTTTVTMEADAMYPSIRIPNHKPFVQVTLKKS